MRSTETTHKVAPCTHTHTERGERETDMHTTYTQELILPCMYVCVCVHVDAYVGVPSGVSELCPFRTYGSAYSHYCTHERLLGFGLTP